MSQAGYTPIQLYYSTTASAAPLAANLAAGELAINTLDEILYFKNSAGTVKKIAAGVNAAVNGGTGQSSYAVGDLLYANTTTTLAKLADVATGNALISGGVGVAPSYGKIGLTTHVSGTLPVANGGTGDTTYTNGQLLIGNTTGNTLTKSTLTAGSGVTITNGTGSITISASGSGGDVVGPASATDNAIARFDTTTGKLIQNSSSFVDDTGAIGIGTSTLTGYSLRSTMSLTSATSFAFATESTLSSAVTTAAYGFRTGLSTAAAAFTLPNAYLFNAEGVTVGAGSTLTNQYGFIVGSSMTGATNNYGFYGGIASGTGRWNLYMNGTAENYLAGNLKVGATTARGTTAGTNHVSLFNGTAPAGTLTNGVTMYSASGDLNFMDSAGNGYKVGYRNIPAVGTKTGSYTLATGDVGKYVQVGSGGSITIPDATFAEGDAITIFNNTASTATITCSITTAYIAGTFTDKATMTLAAAGVATILFISSTVCVVSGNVT